MKKLCHDLGACTHRFSTKPRVLHPHLPRDVKAMRRQGVYLWQRFVHTQRRVADIAIVGGGPAGLSLSAALQHSPQTQHLNVCVIESQPVASRLGQWSQTVNPDVFENRVVSLTPKSVRFLDSIGAWQHVVETRTQPYDEMRVWDGESGANIEFDGWDKGTGEIATMIETSNIQQALLHTADTSSQVLHAGVESISTAADTNWPVLKLSDGSEVEARLLVGADGQNSPVRTYAEIESRGWDYNRFGVVASLELEYDNYRTCAYQRFLRTGPIAMLPMPEGKATLVWSTLPERAQWLRKLEPAAFVAVVNAGVRLDQVDIDYLHSIDPASTDEIVSEVAWRMEQREEISDEENILPVPVEAVSPGTVAAFPLRMRHADSYIGDRVALIGDAAHTTHPLSGQGLNMGQRDVESLVKAIDLAVSRGLDIGSSLALEPYPREAYARNHVLLGVNDKFHKLYSTDFWAVVKLRSYGLNAVNSLGWLKGLIMKHVE